MVNAGVKFFNVTSIMLSQSATHPNHWTRFQISALLLPWCVCVYGYVRIYRARMLWWSDVCVYSHLLHTSLSPAFSFSLSLSLAMWSVRQLLNINYWRKEEKRRRESDEWNWFFIVCTRILMTTNDKRRLSVLDTYSHVQLEEEITTTTKKKTKKSMSTEETRRDRLSKLIRRTGGVR